MWGNDPEVRESYTNPAPKKTIINPKLTETAINDDPSLPAQHLGWSGRLNGPADNPASSCMSCHSTAQYPAISAIMPFLESSAPEYQIPANGTIANDTWMRWFRNFQSNVAFDEGKALTTDFSLQLSKSIENFIDYRAQTQQGHFTIQYWWNDEDVDPISRGSISE